MSRRYRLGRREEAAQQTREKILQAAANLVAEPGNRGVTIQAVAREASVSRVTVYDHFQNKAGRLEALAWWTLERHDIDRVRRARLQENVRAALIDFVRENARFFHSFGRKGRAVLKATRSDPDAAPVIEATFIDARRAAIRELVDRLDDSHELSSTWSPERAVDALMIITSVEAFESLAAHGRLGIDEAAEMLANMASVLLRETVSLN
jgi:AcrR family transcriptional regulator